MGKELIINSGRYETRIALLEDGNLVEFYVERGNDTSLMGNIYKGRINRVLPGMQAAFVEIGLEKAAFLYVADVLSDTKVIGQMMASNENLNAAEESQLGKSSPIEDMLTEGQEILVQITKEPIGTKGARVSSHLSIPGRHLVYMPDSSEIRISRKIEDDDERKRLAEIVSSAMPDEGGFIIRTASAGAEKEEIEADMSFLLKQWEEVKTRGDKIPPTSLIHQDIDMSLRSIRDIITTDVDKIVTDSPENHKSILSFINKVMPKVKDRVSLYDEDEPIFDRFGIEMEIDEMLSEKIWLKSGGYIIIQATEALTAIDVNTGRFTGKKNLEETILKTNLEAAKEIGYQLRLRNLGGIIIVDYIDMVKQESKDKVYVAMQEAMKKDRAVFRISEISELGLLEMTRKRIRNSIAKVMCTPCEYCEGRGYLKSKESISYEILRNIKKEASSFQGDDIKVHVHPEISDILLHRLADDITEIEKGNDLQVSINTNPSLHLEDYHIH
ncbi:MAG: Rne/Rng family ribonuclease [Proteobacteria bacterium]|nr:Rne/Rng family ribonuclease [Pseudomonadota bacterium]